MQVDRIPLRSRLCGFTAAEMMVVVAIIAILAMIAVPSTVSKVVKEQINAALPLADVAKTPVQTSWAALKLLPVDNKAAGLPEADKIVNNFISKVEVVDGAIHMTFGNKAHKVIAGKVITMRPAVIEESQIVPITWVCGHAKAPDKMVIKGENKTNVEDLYLPYLCR